MLKWDRAGIAHYRDGVGGVDDLALWIGCITCGFLSIAFTVSSQNTRIWLEDETPGNENALPFERKTGLWEGHVHDKIRLRLMPGTDEKHRATCGLLPSFRLNRLGDEIRRDEIGLERLVSNV